MEALTITEIDLATGESVTRQMTKSEQETHLKKTAEIEQQQKLKLSALAKLIALGLTEEEIAAL